MQLNDGITLYETSPRDLCFLPEEFVMVLPWKEIFLTASS